MDTLYALYNRSRFSDHNFNDLVGPMLKTDTINLLKQLYQWLIVDPSDIDEAKYLLLKKFSEVEIVGPRPIMFTANDRADDIQHWPAYGRKTGLCTRRE